MSQSLLLKSLLLRRNWNCRVAIEVDVVEVAVTEAHCYRDRQQQSHYQMDVEPKRHASTSSSKSAASSLGTALFGSARCTADGAEGSLRTGACSGRTF